MLYEFRVYGEYKKGIFFSYESNSGVSIGEDEIQRGNKIMALSDENGKIRVSLALEPKVISFCEMHWIFIGEPSMRHEIIWPTNEKMERIASEVSEVLESLGVK
jgi:hypothetical protein